MWCVPVSAVCYVSADGWCTRMCAQHWKVSVCCSSLCHCCSTNTPGQAAAAGTGPPPPHNNSSSTLSTNLSHSLPTAPVCPQLTHTASSRLQCQTPTCLLHGCRPAGEVSATRWARASPASSAAHQQHQHQPPPALSHPHQQHQGQHQHQPGLLLLLPLLLCVLLPLPWLLLGLSWTGSCRTGLGGQKGRRGRGCQHEGRRQGAAGEGEPKQAGTSTSCYAGAHDCMRELSTTLKTGAACIHADHGGPVCSLAA